VPTGLSGSTWATLLLGACVVALVGFPTLLHVYGSHKQPERRLGRAVVLGHDAVASAIPRSQRAAALVPDCQGIGMSRRSSNDGN
jgi:hypothetical protein